MCLGGAALDNPGASCSPTLHPHVGLSALGAWRPSATPGLFTGLKEKTVSVSPTPLPDRLGTGPVAAEYGDGELRCPGPIAEPEGRGPEWAEPRASSPSPGPDGTSSSWLPSGPDQRCSKRMRLDLELGQMGGRGAFRCAVRPQRVSRGASSLLAVPSHPVSRGSGLQTLRRLPQGRPLPCPSC